MGKAFIVTDLGYGDAGKGTTVDFLARQCASSLVVRHCGGAQAAHNVITPDGRHHTFAQFGSGSFVSTSRTHLSRFMLINPLNMMTEAQHLIDLGVHDIWDRTSVDSDALIITPWQVSMNRIRETHRAGNAHGSCGQGVGETQCDSLDAPNLVLRVKDITGNLTMRLRKLRDYKRGQLHLLGTESGVHFDALDSPLFSDDTLIEQLASEYRTWADKVFIINNRDFALHTHAQETIIFEGAQGVLLDEWFGFHPYTTWSTTTHENAFTLLNDIGFDGEVVRLGVMRTYTTRHGAGPLVTHDPKLEESINEMHNGCGEWQGSFRMGWLDLVAHRYACEVAGGVDGIVLTGCDWVGQDWKICNQYSDVDIFEELFEPTDSGNTRIIPGNKRDLNRQQLLAQACAQATPVLETITCIQELEEHIEKALDAPIVIRSFGPSAQEKMCTLDFADPLESTSVYERVSDGDY